MSASISPPRWPARTSLELSTTIQHLVVYLTSEVHCSILCQLKRLIVNRNRLTTSKEPRKEPRYVQRYTEGPDAGAAASPGAPHWPDLQRRAATRVGVARTRGRDDRLAAAGGHLRRARCHPPGGGGPWGEARGREDHGGEQPADDQGHEGAGGGREGRESPSL